MHIRTVMTKINKKIVKTTVLFCGFARLTNLRDKCYNNKALEREQKMLQNKALRIA